MILEIDNTRILSHHVLSIYCRWAGPCMVAGADWGRSGGSRSPGYKTKEIPDRVNRQYKNFITRCTIDLMVTCRMMHGSSGSLRPIREPRAGSFASMGGGCQPA